MGRLKRRLKSKDKVILYTTKLDHPQILIQLFSKNLFEDVHALMGSKLSKQGVQLTSKIILDACKDKDIKKT